ncbi:hypothetical protein [Streptomyces anulatus]|uniref:hypothetical protein n=2 Tax=Streptomyces TaxID=1883 RepID=UPI001D193F5B|nr:hypothetical protein [Streptomyces anulatus]
MRRAAAAEPTFERQNRILSTIKNIKVTHGILEGTPMRPSSLLGAAGTAVVLAAVLTTNTANAAPELPTDGRTMVLPAAPSDAGSRFGAAASPSVSPYAPSKHYGAGTVIDCPKGSLCTHVWDNSSGSYEVFFLDTCTRYWLANWEDRGGYFNNQTGDRATATYYGRNGEKLTDVPVGSKGAYNWSPVWSIRNCY